MIEPGGEELSFRSLAAPWLDEDDLYAAMLGLPIPSPFWGDGRPAARPDTEGPWCEEAERRRRHEELLRKWEPPGLDSPG